ncbi:thiamine diphosphokinase [Dethiothermospora halolimnae]|uniref:thiamine diphosphokinase n=1 Tax=Dethiothermospora halolimnae TaxID=3114390 RepID=UPI003CCBB601
MKTLIISNGDILNNKLLMKECKKADYIICADGGTNHLNSLGVLPDLIVGDLDSIDKNMLNIMQEKKVEFLKFPVKKDKTDTELAIDYAIEHGSREITLVGVTGSRLDHTLANIMLLKKILYKGVQGKIIDNKNEIYITNGNLVLDKREGFYVSLVPLTEKLEKVTLRGVEYETYELNFYQDSSFGISNKIIEDKGYISFEKGISLVILSKD